MHRRFDIRSFAIMFGALALGLVWAAYNYASAGGARTSMQIQPLVWTIFAAPSFLFVGWALARRTELGRAAFVCFCCYFFTPFVAQRIESLVVSAESAQANGHHLYFVTVLVIHGIVGVGLVLWRALALPQPNSADAQIERSQQAIGSQS